LQAVSKSINEGEPWLSLAEFYAQHRDYDGCCHALNRGWKERNKSKNPHYLQKTIEVWEATSKKLSQICLKEKDAYMDNDLKLEDEFIPTL
jgi:hypothetical protein